MKPPTPAEANLAEAQTLLQLWVKAKAFFAKADTQEPVSREEEQAFLDMKSEISRAARSVGPKLPQGVTFAPEKLQEILRQSISISHVRAMPKADRSTLMGNWHHVFIYMSQAVGALQFIAEGYVPPPRAAKAGTGLRDLKGAAGGKTPQKKKSVLKSFWFWAVLIGVAIGGYVLFGNG